VSNSSEDTQHIIVVLQNSGTTILELIHWIQQATAVYSSCRVDYARWCFTDM